jgi:RHS repeat-associated protein
MDASTSSAQSARIATIREGDDFDDSTPAIKYNLDDHLGSSNVLVDENGTLVNREEYYPFGETSFGSYAKKRYRFCGKEKDEESGLYYYGARYYAPWLCRFTSVDPKAGKYVFQSPYAYADNNPINKMDYNGEGTDGSGEASTENNGNQIDTDTRVSGDNLTPQTSAEDFKKLVTVDEKLKPKEPKVSLSDAKQKYKSGEIKKSEYKDIKQQWDSYNDDVNKYNWFQNVIDKYANAADGTIEAESRDKIIKQGIHIVLTDGENSIDPTSELGEAVAVTNGVERQFIPNVGPDYFKIRLDYNRMVANVNFNGQPKTPASIKYNSLEKPSTLAFPSGESIFAHELGHVFFFMDNISKYSSKNANIEELGADSESAAQKAEYNFYKQNYK